MNKWKERFERFMSRDEDTYFICGFNIAVLIAILLH